MAELCRGELFHGHYQVPQQIFISHSLDLRICQTGTIYGGSMCQAKHQNAVLRSRGIQSDRIRCKTLKHWMGAGITL